MLRRSFLLGAGAKVLAECTPPCSPTASYRHGFSNILGRLDLSTACDYHFPANSSRIRRRPWQCWTPPERTRLLKAYRTLIHAAPRMARTSRGLLFAAWWHDHFCALHEHGCLPGDDKCEYDIHSSWAFLPWHRAFIYFHERLIASILGEEDFRLPVWEWECDDRVPEFYSQLPAPFVQAPPRKPRLNIGFEDCHLKAWLFSPDFATFGGNHAASNIPQAPSGPHAAVHSLLCSAMSVPATAAADPVFFTHHANVDRYWWHWQNELGYPFPDGWQDQCLYFHDLSGTLIRIRAGQLEDIGALGYEYSKPRVNLKGLDASVALTASSLVDLVKAFLSVLKPDVLRAITFPPGNKLTTGYWVNALGQLLLNTPVPIKIPITGRPDMQAGHYYLVGIRKAGTKDDPTVIGGFGVFGQTPACIPAGGCIRGKDVSAVLKILLGAGSPPELVYAEATSCGDGTLELSEYGRNTANLCDPLRILYFKESKAIADALLTFL